MKWDKLLNILKTHTNRSEMAQKHAAMLVTGGKVVSIGYNHERTASAKKMILSYHAEVHALSKYILQSNLGFLKNYINDTEQCVAYKRFDSPRKNKLSPSSPRRYRPFQKNLKIFVIRTDKQGNLKNSRPCRNCLETMKFFGVKTVYFSTDEGNIEKYRVDHPEWERHHISGKQKFYHKICSSHNCKN